MLGEYACLNGFDDARGGVGGVRISDDVRPFIVTEKNEGRGGLAVEEFKNLRWSGEREVSAVVLAARQFELTRLLTQPARLQQLPPSPPRLGIHNTLWMGPSPSLCRVLPKLRRGPPSASSKGTC